MADPAFSTIGLMGKFGDPGVADALRSLAGTLLQRETRVLLDESTAEIVPGHGLETADRHTIGSVCDLAIVVGGDGTLLNAARSLSQFDVPLLGINLGRLGFLVDVSPADMNERLNEILSGQFTTEERILLQASVQRGGECISESRALNDVVVRQWDIARMIELETYIGGQFLNTQRSDGLIVASPTGSTAYALSGGGPVIHPALDVITLVPICPHTLSNRPIVLDARSQVDIVVGAQSHAQAQLTCDGQISVSLEVGDRVQVRVAERRIRLVHPTGYDYFQILRAKLHWGGDALYGAERHPLKNER